MRLVKMILVHEYETDMSNNWVGKIWEWKYRSYSIVDSTVVL